MRLGLLIYGSLEIVTGGFMYDKLVVEYLRRQGDEVEVIALPWHPYGLSLSHNVWPYVKNRVLRGHFEALIQDELMHPSVFWLNHRLKSHLQYPIISLVHSLRSTEERPAWQNRIYRRVEQRYLQSVDRFIFISEHTRRLVQSLTGENKFSTIAYPAGNRLGGMTPEEIWARSELPGPRQILFLGAVVPNKGLHVLLQALAGLKKEDWHLTVAGSLNTDRSYSQKIYRLIRGLGISHKVALPGLIRGEDLINCMRRSHILAVPSYMEGLALVYLEAMYFGLVPFAASRGAAGEVITPEVNGFLIPPNDVETLKNYLGDLLQDHRKLLAMSLAARERIARHPTWEATGATIRAFLQSLITRT